MGHRGTCVLAVLVLAPLVGRAHAQQAPGFKADDAATVVRELAKKIGMPWDKRESVMKRTRDLLASGKIREKVGTGPLGAVLAYHLGEGGLFVKFKKGSGRVRFLDGTEHELQLKSVTVGAQVGGSSEWGIGLVVGLGRDVEFGGDYTGSNASATMAVYGAGVTELTRKGAGVGHRVYLVSTASGASLNAGGGSLEIIVKR